MRYLNSNKPSLPRLSCRNKGWRLFLTSGLYWRKNFELYSLILIPNIGYLIQDIYQQRIKWECDSSCSPYQKHYLCGRILVLWSHDSKGGNNELIEYRTIRIIFGPDNILPEPDHEIDLKDCLYFEQFMVGAYHGNKIDKLGEMIWPQFPTKELQILLVWEMSLHKKNNHL